MRLHAAGCIAAAMQLNVAAMQLERFLKACTWLLAVGTSMLPMKIEWLRAKLWFSGFVRSNRKPSKRSGFSDTAQRVENRL